MQMASGSPAAALWRGACSVLKEKLNPLTFEGWFSGIVPVALDNGAITLGVSDDFFATWMTTHYGELITDAISCAAGAPMRFVFEAGHTPPVRTTESAAQPDEPKQQGPSSEAPEIDAAILPGRGRYTFENFVVGDENRFAFATARSAVEQPGTHNPVFVHGSTGLGKTHLLLAIGCAAAKRGERIQYTTCENFLNAYIESLKDKQHAEFRNRFRTAGVLLLDDIHQLIGKPQLQEEFFNTFNHLHHTGKQIVLTSDRAPSEIKGLESRLISRFESGVSARIEIPGYETRLEILRNKRATMAARIGEPILEMLAGRIASNVRQLEGALLQLAVYSSAMGGIEITNEIAEKLLAPVFAANCDNDKFTILDVQRAVAGQFGIRMEDMLSSSRKKEITLPRMVAMHVAREIADFSFPEIGEAFGGKNHTTVIHAHRKIAELAKNDTSIRNRIGIIMSKLAKS